MPNGRRTADGLALALLEHTVRGNREEQLFVFRATARVLGIAMDEQRAEALEAVEACCAARGLDLCPSRDEYRAWLRQQSEWEGWPGDYAIAHAFGGEWSAVRRAVNSEPVPDFAAGGLGNLGSAASDEALLAGVRLWADPRSGGEFRFAGFREFALDQLRKHSSSEAKSNLSDDPQASAAQREELAFAVSPNTYISRFGSWVETLAAAGALGGVTFEEFRQLVSASKEYAPERLVDTVRAAATWADTEGLRLTRKTFDEYRDGALRAGWQAGSYEPIPSAQAITSRLGSLIEAMHRAGVIDSAEAARRHSRRGRKLPLERLAAHVRVCVEHRSDGDPSALEERTYTEWRDTLVDVLGAPVPASLTIRQRFETLTWRETVAAAMDTLVDGAELAALRRQYTDALASRAHERVMGGAERCSCCGQPSPPATEPSSAAYTHTMEESR